MVGVWNGFTVLLRQRGEVCRGHGSQLCPPLGGRVLGSRGDTGELSHYFQTVIDGPGFHNLAARNPIKSRSGKAKGLAGWAGAHKLASVHSGNGPARGNGVTFNDHVFLRDLEVREGGVQHRDEFLKACNALDRFGHVGTPEDDVRRYKVRYRLQISLADDFFEIPPDVRLVLFYCGHAATSSLALFVPCPCVWTLDHILSFLHRVNGEMKSTVVPSCPSLTLRLPFLLSLSHCP